MGESLFGLVGVHSDYAGRSHLVLALSVKVCLPLLQPSSLHVLARIYREFKLNLTQSAESIGSLLDYVSLVVHVLRVHLCKARLHRFPTSAREHPAHGSVASGGGNRG